MGNSLPGSPDFFPSTKQRRLSSCNEPEAHCLLSVPHQGNPDPPDTLEKPKGREETLKEGREGAESKRGSCGEMDRCSWRAMERWSQALLRGEQNNRQWAPVATREIPIRDMEKFFPCESGAALGHAPEQWWRLHPWRSSKPIWPSPEQPMHLGSEPDAGLDPLRPSQPQRARPCRGADKGEFERATRGTKVAESGLKTA